MVFSKKAIIYEQLRVVYNLNQIGLSFRSTGIPTHYKYELVILMPNEPVTRIQRTMFLLWSLASLCHFSFFCISSINLYHMTRKLGRWRLVCLHKAALLIFCQYLVRWPVIDVKVGLYLRCFSTFPSDFSTWGNISDFNWFMPLLTNDFMALEIWQIMDFLGIFNKIWKIKDKTSYSCKL